MISMFFIVKVEDRYHLLPDMKRKWLTFEYKW